MGCILGDPRGQSGERTLAQQLRGRAHLFPKTGNELCACPAHEPSKQYCWLVAYQTIKALLCDVSKEQVA